MRLQPLYTETIPYRHHQDAHKYGDRPFQGGVPLQDVLWPAVDSLDDNAPNQGYHEYNRSLGQGHRLSRYT